MDHNKQLKLTQRKAGERHGVCGLAPPGKTLATGPGWPPADRPGQVIPQFTAPWPQWTCRNKEAPPAARSSARCTTTPGNPDRLGQLERRRQRFRRPRPVEDECTRHGANQKETIHSPTRLVIHAIIQLENQRSQMIIFRKNVCKMLCGVCSSTYLLFIVQHVPLPRFICRLAITITSITWCNVHITD